MKNIKILSPSFLQKIVLFVFSISFFSISVFASDLDQQIGKLQVDVNAVEKEISDLEKDLLFPPLTRIEVYLSVATTIDYTLRSVSLSLDGEEKGFHIYSDSDLAALKLGGLQQFWEGNVSLGKHKLEAKFIGVDSKGAKLDGVANFDFEKTQTGRAVELSVTTDPVKKIPVFSVKDWGNK